MNQAAETTGGQQNNPPPQPPPDHQVTLPTINPTTPVIMNEYNSFNLANVTLSVVPKWENNEFALDEYCKF